MLIKDSGYLFAMLKMCDDIELYKQKFGSTLLDERVLEIAAMMGGQTALKSAEAGAIELLAKGLSI